MFSRKFITDIMVLCSVLLALSGVVKCYVNYYEGWNFNFGKTPLDWIQELLE